MHEDCSVCRFRRNCINGLYCMQLNDYVQYTKKKKCELNNQKENEDKRF